MTRLYDSNEMHLLQLIIAALRADELEGESHVFPLVILKPLSKN